MTVSQTRASSRSKSDRPRAPAKGEEAQRRAPQTAASQTAARPTRGRPAAFLNGEAPIDAEMREAMIREAAYFRAESRGFQAGHEVQDWLAAEREFDRWLATRAAPRRYGR